VKSKRISIRAAAGIVALLSLLLFVAACSDDGDDADPTATEVTAEDPTATEQAAEDPTATEQAPVETTIDVSLVEFAVEPSTETASAGSFTFNVSSDGAIFHNLRVIATDLDADGLPTDDDTFSVDEDELDVVASGEDLNPGEEETLTVELAAGSYVLICNIPTHYEAGMTIALTVE
jgi:uncharacterized cupredoxin-like copper-binding protein